MAVTNEKIFEKLSDVSVSLARIEGRVMSVENSSAELMKVVIKGNGKLPLIERVTAIENRHCDEDSDKKSDKEKKDKFSGRAWAVILIFIGQAVIWIFLFLRTGAVFLKGS